MKFYLIIPTLIIFTLFTSLCEASEVKAGTITLNDTVAVTLESKAVITITGAIKCTGTGSVLNCNSDADIWITGSWSVVTFYAGTSTVYFNGSTQGITVGSGTPYFYNLVISGTDVSTSSGSPLVIAPNGKLEITPNNTSTSSNYSITNQTVTFGSNASLLVQSGGELYATNVTFTTSNPGTDRFTFEVNGNIALNNCSITSTDANGLNLKSQSKIDEFTNVNFWSHPGGNGTFMGVACPINGNFPGCYFDTITSGYNVTATGASSTLLFSLYNAGPGAGKSLSSDDDPDGNGVANNGYAVILWLQNIVTQTASTGGIQGFPTPAFDLDTYDYYSTYVVSRDITGTDTADRLFVLDENGIIQYYYDVTHSTYGNIVGNVWWYKESSQHTVYFGTTAGYIFRLVDTGVSLDFAVSPGWPMHPCDQVTSGVITDGINIYFGGYNTVTPTIFAYVISTRVQLFALSAASAVSALPSWAISSTTTYLFIGSDYKALTANNTDLQITNGLSYVSSTTGSFVTNGVDPYDVLVITSGKNPGRYRIITVNSETQITVDHTFTETETSVHYTAGQTPLLYRVNVTTGLIDKQNYSAFDHLRAPTVYWERGGNYFLFAGDYYGRMQGVNPFTEKFDNLPDTWPVVPTVEASYAPYSITTIATVVYDTTFRIIYSDMGGWVYNCSDTGKITDGYPFQPGGTTAIESSALVVDSGLIYLGNNDGKVFAINESTATVTKTYSLGSGIHVGNISRDPDTHFLLVPTSNGNVYYLNE